ncbi:MAG: hypothetical protein KZY55_15540 [Paeniclostridium sp.]|uniref:hypothetical protein n=1 Tax=Clostridium perfringens TaxID=1502 RepID=UPI001E0195E9|nr:MULTISPECIES: hypothetical protein [Clostridia]MBW4863488.1 hypothetical protein [Paeniclostridium sp.]MBW4875470.1 hypothetical protein [Paeniclostridium sp.]
MARCKRCNIKLEMNTTGAFYSPSVHNKDYCGNCYSWNIIFKNFKEIHSASEHWMDALNDIEILLKKYKKGESPDPIRFERMLYDRGLTFSDIDKRVWNLSSDQCLPWHVTKYYSDNKAEQALKKIFNLFTL